MKRMIALLVALVFLGVGACCEDLGCVKKDDSAKVEEPKAPDEAKKEEAKPEQAKVEEKKEPTVETGEVKVEKKAEKKAEKKKAKAEEKPKEAKDKGDKPK